MIRKEPNEREDDGRQLDKDQRHDHRISDGDSPGKLKSRWCDFELRVANLKGKIGDGRDFDYDDPAATGLIQLGARRPRGARRRRRRRRGARRGARAAS